LDTDKIKCKDCKKIKKYWMLYLKIYYASSIREFKDVIIESDIIPPYLIQRWNKKEKDEQKCGFVSPITYILINYKEIKE